MSNEIAKNRIKIIIAGIFAIAALFAVVLLIVTHTANKGVEIYNSQDQTVQLFADGRFTATLADNVQKNGTYTKRDTNGLITVLFNTNGDTDIGEIVNNSLLIPREWDNGHGNVFPKTE